MFWAKSPVVIFPDEGTVVAKITLFTDPDKISNLSFIAPRLLKRDLTLPRSVRKEQPITKILRKLEKTAIYTATWVDEDTKIEFVAKLDEPYLNPIFVSYRRLAILSDDQGTVIPFGKKANISGEKVTKILTERKSQVVGNLVFAPL